MFHVFVRSTLMKTVGQKGIKKGIKNIKTDNSDKKMGIELLAKQLKADYLVIKIIGIPPYDYWMLFFAYFYHVFLLWWKL